MAGVAAADGCSEPAAVDGCGAAGTVCGAVRSRRGDGDGPWLRHGEGKGATAAGWLQAVPVRSQDRVGGSGWLELGGR